MAENIARAIAGRPTRPFSYKPLGVFCAIGGRHAVAEIVGRRVSGFVAWFLWRAIYLFKLPSWSRRVKVGADWAWDLLFARDLVNLKTDPTERVSHAHFRAGDFVFRQGDPALNFYSVEKGTLDIVRTDEDGAQELVAVLGPGDFFGEMALIEGRPRSASVQARTDVEVTTLGAQVFSRVSKALAPLQERLAQAIRQRTTRVWTRMQTAISGWHTSRCCRQCPSHPTISTASPASSTMRVSRRGCTNRRSSLRSSRPNRCLGSI